MNLRYKVSKASMYDGYGINCPNIFFYRYWESSLPEGRYNNRFVGLYFSKFFYEIFKISSGIKIDYRR